MSFPQYELAGVNAGKTINLGGFQFTDGVYTHQSEDQTVEGLTIYLERSYYAFPAGSQALAEAQARYEREQKTGLTEQPGDVVDTEAAPASTEGGETTSAVKAAVDALDPNDDGHWTAQGLPSIEAVADLAGEKVTRAQIDAVAPGYNRAAAKAAANI